MGKPTEGQLLAAAVTDLVLTGHKIEFVEFATGSGYWCFCSWASRSGAIRKSVGDGMGVTKMEALENMFADRATMRL